MSDASECDGSGRTPCLICGKRISLVDLYTPPCRHHIHAKCALKEAECLAPDMVLCCIECEDTLYEDISEIKVFDYEHPPAKKSRA